MLKGRGGGSEETTRLEREEREFGLDDRCNWFTELGCGLRAGGGTWIVAVRFKLMMLLEAVAVR